VPYPSATADHHTKNAEIFERDGAAVVVHEEELGRVPELVRSLLADGARLGAMREAMSRLARPEAATDIAEEVLTLARA
jgi:UDP-N-acetylglucosamine--N-acetylmuramyl-(pentapeptide) pyrophosphoryl-undecaprenol N-acetylglucosamine transferase